MTKRIEEMKIWITIESFMSFIAMDLLFSFNNDAVDVEMKEVHSGR